MFLDPSTSLASADMATSADSSERKLNRSTAVVSQANATKTSADAISVGHTSFEKIGTEEANSAAENETDSTADSAKGHQCPVLKSYLSPWLAPLVYSLGEKLVLPTYFSRIQVTGQENIPTDGPVVLAPTHQARWDPLLVGLLCKRAKRYPRFMVTADECLGVQGWFIRRLGGFPVHVRKPSIKSLRHGVDLLKAKEMLVIYPEGNIYRDRIHPLKPGLARIALRAERSDRTLGVKVVPISIEYSEPCPKWRGSAKVSVGEPMSVSTYLKGDSKAQSKQLTADLQNELTSLAASNAQG